MIASQFDGVTTLPVHVTLRVQPGIGYLRAYRRTKLLEDAFRKARRRDGMRIVHYSIQGNHLHLLVEVDDAEALARGMQGLAIRIAKRLNALIDALAIPSMSWKRTRRCGPSS